MRRSVGHRFAPMVLFAGLALPACAVGDATPAYLTREWTHFGGDRGFTRYAPLAQIDRDNVGELVVAWRRPGLAQAFSDSFPDLRRTGRLSGTPIIAGGVLYAPNSAGLVEAFHPATGETVWLQQPFPRDREGIPGRGNQGLDLWSDGTETRLVGVSGRWLQVLDPATGRPFPGFGEDGRVDLVPEGASGFNWMSGPVVVNDVVVVGGTVDGAGDGGFRWRGRPREDIRGYDVRTGELRWTFHVVPQEGEAGVETWGDGSWRHAGDQGSWCCLSADESLGYVYVPLSAPTAAYYGGHRPGDNLFSNSLVALDARTGERVWHFQMVHHDLWEYDTVGPPTLGEIRVDGRTVAAVMQPSKTGFLYVFDRATGEPVWPIEERAVPASTVPGEHAAPTQPFPTKPAPFDRQGVTMDDIIDFPGIGERARARADSFLLGSIFTPPPLVTEGSDGIRGVLQVPGIWGAGNWHTGAFDPETGMYYAASHTLPMLMRVVEADGEGAEMDYWAPWGSDDDVHVDGVPIVKPPWGRITAIDMNTGEHAWMVPNGDALRDHPALRELDLPPTGLPSRAAALVTRTLLFVGEGGSVFGGMHPDMWGNRFRAYDKATGEVLAELELPAGATGAPMTYMFEGKQYVVVPIGGRDHPTEWIALSVP